ncbi:MAG: TonB-dependent receptor [Candidatus Symbiothrix sp.]|jgi:TonB-linked SusC/RagA family outer membrane protein|nr:TonB-dependent receptor [Candidatus Symbiothrix sp.]
MKKSKLFFLVVLLSITCPIFAQQKLAGRVLDGITGDPIIGASVSVVSEKTGTATNIDGGFSVQAKSLPTTLIISYLGYRTLEVDVYEYTEPLEVYLQEERNLLNEVVVVGYGTQKRKELTGAVTSISKEILAQPVVSLDNLLGGAVAGLNISEGGQPGSTFSARIRGGNSITAGNEPLFVVDGVILYGNSATNAGVGRVSANLNPLSSINPNDIENIQVLKDVSATAIYGSRGSNGVIIVTTKNGRKGKDKIDYQYSIGWQTATKKLELLNGQEWAVLNREIEGPLKDATDIEIAAIGKGYDWQDEALRTAVTQSHQLSISGGDDRTRYAISGNYTDQDGILVNTNFKRYVGRLNFERDVLNNLKAILNVNASKLKQNGLGGYAAYTNNLSSNFQSVLLTSPANPIYNADGSYNYHNKFEVGDLIKGDGVTTNAISDLKNTTSENNANTLLGNLALEYKIIPDLRLKLAGGTNITNATSNYYAPSSSAGGFASNGYASVGNRRTDVWQYEFTANYIKQLNEDHYIDALAGYTTQNTNTEYATSTAANFANEQVLWHSLQSGNTLSSPESGGTESILNSYIGRINYTFKGRYNLTATLRADGSSRFAPKHRWGYFPSVGVSWNITDEAFLHGLKNLNELKLRASLGTVGNQEIGDYRYAATYSSVDPNENRNQIYAFNNQLSTGYVRRNAENPDLKWEQTTAYNVGVDASLFNHRLSLTADAYYKKTTDLLLNIPTSITSGFSSVLRNVGSVSNKGLELEATGHIIDQRKFKWSVSGNIAKNINKVISLGGLKNIGSSIFLDRPLGNQYYIVFDGIVQKDDDLTKIVGPSWKKTVEYGDEKFVNQSDVLDGEGNPIKSVDESNDRVHLGSSNPDITYGFSTTVAYRDFSLFVGFQGVSGNKIYNSLRQSLETPSRAYNGLSTLLDRWTENNPSNSIPKARVTSQTYSTSRYLEDGAYLRLKNVTLNYNVPVKIQGAPSAKLRLFVSGQNLLTFTKFTGYDPESGGGFGYPVAKTVSFGVNISY